MDKSFKSIFEYNCKESNGWSHVKEIPKIPYLISLHHSYKNANMEIFDISNKGKIKKIYSSEQVNGSKNTFS